MPASGVFISWLTDETNSALRFCSTFWSPMSRSTATVAAGRLGRAAIGPDPAAAVTRNQRARPSPSAISISSLRLPVVLLVRGQQQID